VKRLTIANYELRITNLQGGVLSGAFRQA